MNIEMYEFIKSSSSSKNRAINEVYVPRDPLLIVKAQVEYSKSRLREGAYVKRDAMHLLLQNALALRVHRCIFPYVPMYSCLLGDFRNPETRFQNFIHPKNKKIRFD